ncbi:MAG: YqeG family HAD IIIA-type phosphatase [Candidatus Gastranaerophilales bacterium]|nr:YqeG family HAD IIIA-type phosphatase [Candidatus Gastranaerophilales bacterium]
MLNLEKLPLKPDFNIESIYDIDIMKLDEMGIKALFFDLDSTLMKSKSGKFSFKTLQFLKDLSTNFKLAIITNNSKYSYIKKAKSQTDIPIYYKAQKPKTGAIMRACVDLEVEVSKCAMIGDRPLSDILAGKNAGTVTILVDSISKNEESPIVRFARFLERLTIKKG